MVLSLELGEIFWRAGDFATERTSSSQQQVEVGGNIVK